MDRLRLSSFIGDANDHKIHFIGRKSKYLDYLESKITLYFVISLF